ncbi:MAG: hypothetical protein AAF497_03385 [Planctomycetota bacterium]
MDIAFSDHRIPVANLEQLGNVIRTINSATDDPDARFWTFISYVSRNHEELLSSTPPPELQERIDHVLASIDLPAVELKLKKLPADDGPPAKTIKLPQLLFDRYSTENNFVAIASVQVRDDNGTVYSATLMDDNGPLLLCHEDCPLTPDNIAAIRKAPGCLFGWLAKPKWIEQAEAG